MECLGARGGHGEDPGGEEKTVVPVEGPFLLKSFWRGFVLTTKELIVEKFPTEFCLTWDGVIEGLHWEFWYWDPCVVFCLWTSLATSSYLLSTDRENYKKPKSTTTISVLYTCSSWRGLVTVWRIYKSFCERNLRQATHLQILLLVTRRKSFYVTFSTYKSLHLPSATLISVTAHPLII